MTLDGPQVLAAIDGLRQHEFAWLVRSVDARVPKYEENVAKKLYLTMQETAALTVLLLRGPQTTGEIRSRTGRIYPFEDMEEVTASLEALAERDEPLVMRLPLQPGRKEARYMHLMAGEPDLEAMAEAPQQNWAPQPAAAIRNDALTERVDELERQLAELQQQFTEFKAQFE